VDPDGGPGCRGDVSEISPEVDEVVALEEVVVVVVVAVVPLARWSDPGRWWWSSALAPSLSESVDSPVNGTERIWLALYKNSTLYN